MKSNVTVSSIVDDFRISRTKDGLVVEVLDYHAGPLTLSRSRLAEFGFVPAKAGSLGPPNADGEITALANRALDLLERDLSYDADTAVEIEKLRLALRRTRAARNRAPSDPAPFVEW